MEAMAMGLPVIATYWSGTTEFLSDDNAFLLRPVTSMTRIHFVFFVNSKTLLGCTDPP